MPIAKKHIEIQLVCKSLTKAARSHPRNSPVLITFIEDEAKRLHQPHFDALVVDLEIKRYQVMRNLIDNEIFGDIIFA